MRERSRPGAEETSAGCRKLGVGTTSAGGNASAQAPTHTEARVEKPHVGQTERRAGHGGDTGAQK